MDIDEKKNYIAIEHTMGMFIDIGGPDEDVLIFQTHPYSSYYHNSIEYLPVVNKDFIDRVEEDYPDLVLKYYESLDGSMVNFWKDHPKAFEENNGHWFIKTKNKKYLI